ncbi:sugar-binding transcriptional regulator [Corynebacterium sp.]|uniref:sugar-binding transcriptional regulator n=1 Tax=Corynebacterium sp. TaxID=1720 RepID=UPI0026DAA79F|nr:sugar-binding transcriptional regulator [Corynebacterium sp.]MDO5031298.1 sugar-binding transcriptional regulator [Corynebacterium sp.]
MLDERDGHAIDAAKLYYNSRLSQAEVAARLGISRPTVSKLLQRAQERGFVTIVVHDPRERSDELVEKLKERFSLVDARVVTTPAGGSPLRDLGSAGAALLEELVKDGQSVGISWGETMASVGAHLRELPLEGVQVVQLKGGHSHTERSTKDAATLQAFARAFNAETFMLPLPVIFDSAEAKEWVVKDRHIASILQRGAAVDVAVFTAGAPAPESLALNLGYLSPAETQMIVQRAVGDVCSRFYTATGEVAAPEVDARTVGITLEDLAARPVRVLVAGGTTKAQAIRVALEMGLATHLVIDHLTAQRVLEDSASV